MATKSTSETFPGQVGGKELDNIAASAIEAERKARAVEDLDWAKIVTAEQAFEAFKSLGIPVTKADDYGDGFKLMPDKDKGRLVGVPFICVNARIAQGDHGQFSILHVITYAGDKWIVTDGSSGINKQVQTHGLGVFIGLVCENGLTVSEYEYEDVDPKTGEVKMKPAKTYYIDGMK